MMVLPGILQGQGIENPNVGSRFGPPAQVPSAAQAPRRMITPSDPSYGAGNNIVTGTVGGMKYFRGVVPYGSSYYTGGSLDAGSTSVDDFRRRSADPIVTDRNPGRVQPYYEPERTTSRFVRPQTMATPSGPSVGRVAPTSPYVLSTSPQMLDARTRQRPLSTDARQVEELLSRQQLLAQENLPSLDSKLLTERIVVEPAERPDALPAVPLLPQQRTLPVEPKPLPEQEVQAQIQNELDQALRQQESIPTEGRPLPEAVEGLPQKPEIEGLPQPEGEQSAAQQDLLPDPREQANIAAQGRQIMGEHKTYDSLAYAKYAGYMQTAESYIKEGKFYKAADVYELAALWRPEESRSYLGKGFALLAAGEYMSSSYYISRAIELEPVLASKSFDLPKLLGDRDMFENRLLELEGWQERSGSGELAFLQAYVLYQDGRAEAAAEAIAKAVKVMPESKAVQKLSQVLTPQTQAP